MRDGIETISELVAKVLLNEARRQEERRLASVAWQARKKAQRSRTQDKPERIHNHPRAYLPAGGDRETESALGPRTDDYKFS